MKKLEEIAVSILCCSKAEDISATQILWPDLNKIRVSIDHLKPILVSFHTLDIIGYPNNIQKSKQFRF